MDLEWENGRGRTVLLPHTSRPPMGAKRIPMIKRVGRTAFGVRMGCHAFRRCWRKAVSIILHNQPLYVPMFMLPAQSCAPKSPTYSEASGSFASCPARHVLVYCWNPRAPWFATCSDVRITLRWVGLEGEAGRCPLVAARVFPKRSSAVAAKSRCSARVSHLCHQCFVTCTGVL